MPQSRAVAWELGWCGELPPFESNLTPMQSPCSLPGGFLAASWLAGMPVGCSAWMGHVSLMTRALCTPHVLDPSHTCLRYSSFCVHGLPCHTGLHIIPHITCMVLPSYTSTWCPDWCTWPPSCHAPLVSRVTCVCVHMISLASRVTHLYACAGIPCVSCDSCVWLHVVSLVSRVTCVCLHVVSLASRCMWCPLRLV